MNTRSLISRSSVRALFAAATLAAVTIAGRATTIVDTGTPDNSIWWSFGDYQYFAGQFTVGSATDITDVQGYFGNTSSGSVGLVTIALHADAGNNTPDAILFSDDIALAAGAQLNWYGLSGLNWSIGPGTYWVSFKPDANIGGTMPGIAPNPLSVYAQAYGNYNWAVANSNTFDYLKVGIRVEGNPSGVPDSGSTMLLLGGALLGVAALRRRIR